jgi:hypothetical protein
MHLCFTSLIIVVHTVCKLLIGLFERRFRSPPQACSYKGPKNTCTVIVPSSLHCVLISRKSNHYRRPRTWQKQLKKRKTSQGIYLQTHLPSSSAAGRPDTVSKQLEPVWVHPGRSPNRTDAKRDRPETKRVRRPGSSVRNSKGLPLAAGRREGWPSGVSS